MKLIGARRLTAATALCLALGTLAHAQPAAVGTATPADKPWLRSVRINVADFDKSVAFYTKVVGLGLAVPSGTEEGYKMAVFTPSGKYTQGESLMVIGWDAKRTRPIDPEAIGWLSFYVPDVDAAVARVKAAGYAVTREPGPVDPNARLRVAIVKDPDGYKIELMNFKISPPPP